MKPLSTVFAVLLAFTACKAPETKPDISFPLKEYVMAEDDAFRYTVVDTVVGDDWTEYKVRMVSGTWLTENEVDHTEWWHWLNIIVPDRLRETESMMIIGGGSANDTLPVSSESWLIEAAVATGSIISEVSNIPFQPINYKGDQKDDRYEDDLIAYGWKQYLESGASEDKLEWLARFPMTRAVVRAMDVVQEISMVFQTPVQSFFVTGASKRGWTTWTTAAVDDRVMGIAPIVIDLLNIVPSFNHHWRCYGEWSPAVNDYVNEGIMDQINSEEFKALLEMVGPYSFVDQLTMPKLLVNATCDEFFVTDSWKFYWDDLTGENYLQYVPNGNHGLEGTYQFPISLISFYYAIITDTRIPEFSWNISNDTIYMQVDPESDYIIRRWEVVNDKDRDFRIWVIGQTWQKEELDKRADGNYAVHFSNPESGYKAGLVEITFNPESEFPLTFTSGTLVTPDEYPFPPFQPGPIRINQLGFYPQSVKEFILVDQLETSFQVIDENGKICHKGEMVNNGTWDASGEDVLMGDFSNLSNPGKYLIRLGSGLVSSPFEIRGNIHKAALNASIKSFYYQRASMAIEEQFGGIYKRAAGHPDSNCTFHPSTGKENGSLNSAGGWYDAGDYGKYVGNAAITAGQMLNLVELYPDVVKDSQLNIPESGNGISDLLDEIRYELDWVTTMQDSDGGVFHKLTAKRFGGFVMPEDYDLDRFIIGKSTTASLNFAAIMAQATRVYHGIDPEWAEVALRSAEKAWEWSVSNNNIPFRNPEDVSTGEYGDNKFSDDFYWAASELYISTGKNQYLDYLLANEEPYIHQLTNSWKFFIRNMGFHSLLAHMDQLDPDFADTLTKKHLELADQILVALEEIPYHVSLDLFEWGSNSDVLNQAMILCYAHHITGDQKYLNGAVQNVDYIFGKNATGYSFLTGFGSRKVMNPHHRPSGADGIDEPVPGFILGGPNKDRQDRQYVEYASEFPAKSFEDVQASYASNEVCLNWNAPAVFVLGYLEEVH